MAGAVFQLFLSFLLTHYESHLFSPYHGVSRNSFGEGHFGNLESAESLVNSKRTPLSCTSIHAVNISPAALIKMEIDSMPVASKQDCKLLKFLYESGVADQYVPDYARSATLLALFERGDEFQRNAFERLNRLLSDSGDVGSDSIPSDVMSFETAIELMPEWQSNLTSYVFFRDDPDIQYLGVQVVVQRVQQNSLCHMYAPVLMQYYLLLKYKHGNGVSTILNLAKYIREVYNPRMLASYIIEGKGILSDRFLSSILGEDSVVRMVNFNKIDTALLKRYGPVLLTMFNVCDDFGVEGRLVYSLDGCNATPREAPVYIGCDFLVLEDRLLFAKGYETMGRCRGYHAMVIVGVRKVGSSRRFLVQNWWRRHQFVEISQEYLETQPPVGPSAYVVHSAPRAIPARFAQRAWRYAESTQLDTPEMEPADY